MGLLQEIYEEIRTEKLSAATYCAKAVARQRKVSPQNSRWGNATKTPSLSTVRKLMQTEKHRRLLGCPTKGALADLEQLEKNLCKKLMSRRGRAGYVQFVTKRPPRWALYRDEQLLMVRDLIVSANRKGGLVVAFTDSTGSVISTKSLDFRGFKRCHWFAMKIEDVLNVKKHPGVSVTALDFLTTDQSVQPLRAFLDQWYADLGRLTKARRMRPSISVTDQCMATLTALNSVWNGTNLRQNLIDCWDILHRKMSESDILCRTSNRFCASHMIHKASLLLRAANVTDRKFKNFVLAVFACFIQCTDLETVGQLLLHAFTLFLFPVRNAAVTRSWQFLEKLIGDTNSEEERDTMLEGMRQLEQNIRDNAVLVRDSDPEFEANVIRDCTRQMELFQPEYIASNSELGLMEGSPFYCNFGLHILNAVEAAISSQALSKGPPNHDHCPAAAKIFYGCLHFIPYVTSIVNDPVRWARGNDPSVVNENVPLWFTNGRIEAHFGTVKNQVLNQELRRTPADFSQVYGEFIDNGLGNLGIRISGRDLHIGTGKKWPRQLFQMGFTPQLLTDLKSAQEPITGHSVSSVVSSDWPGADEVICRVQIPLGLTPLSRPSNDSGLGGSVYDEDIQCSDRDNSPSPSLVGGIELPVMQSRKESYKGQWFQQWAEQFSDCDGNNIQVSADPIEFDLYNSLCTVIFNTRHEREI